MARKKGGQKLKDLGKRRPKIKVDLTPHYRPKPPPRGKPTKGPAISSPTRPPTKNIIGPSLWGPPDQEGRLKSRKPKPVKGGSRPPKLKPPAWIKRGVWPGFQRKRTKMGGPSRRPAPKFDIDVRSPFADQAFLRRVSRGS